MKLSPHQIQQFERDGYLFFPSLFRPDEIKVLVDEVPRLYAQLRPENVREKDSDAVRTNVAAHMYSYPFAKLESWLPLHGSRREQRIGCERWRGGAA